MAHKNQRLESYRAFMDARVESNLRTYGALESGLLTFDGEYRDSAWWYPTFAAPFFNPRHPQVPCDSCGTPVHEFYARVISGIGMCRDCMTEHRYEYPDDDFHYTGFVREPGNYDRGEYIQGVRHCPDCETHADTADLECRKCGAPLGCAACWDCETTYCPTCGQYHRDNDPKYAADREARAIERAERMAEDIAYAREELGYYD